MREMAATVASRLSTYNRFDEIISVYRSNETFSFSCVSRVSPRQQSFRYWVRIVKKDGAVYVFVRVPIARSSRTAKLRVLHFNFQNVQHHDDPENQDSGLPIALKICEAL